ncbi:unnamed protein product [Amoebophrya sp. A120]|nr:unnamed protein product [Amoebophrya sp. A120]|eukprot:GSA120T00025744001.1
MLMNTTSISLLWPMRMRAMKLRRRITKYKKKVNAKSIAKLGMVNKNNIIVSSVHLRGSTSSVCESSGIFEAVKAKHLFLRADGLYRCIISCGFLSSQMRHNY